MRGGDKLLLKEHYNSIVGAFNNIADRFEDYSGFSREQWNW